MTEAIVVGSGPNGLAAGITLARQGLRVTVLEAADAPGGGARSSELTVPGLLHDHCSAVHPFGVASPFMRTLRTDCPPDKQVQWVWPTVDVAHPLDNGAGGVLARSLDDTARWLGTDGAAWKDLFAPLAENFDLLAGELLRPIAHLPEHLRPLIGYGTRALLPATWLARRWRTPNARALFGGVAAHQINPLTGLASAGLGMMLIAAAHQYGWPVARGGSQAITDAMVATLLALGGKIETSVRIDSIDEVAHADVVMLDTTPSAAAGILGHRMPGHIRTAFHRFRHGPGAFKVDIAVEGGIPWADERCADAGTVHLGGDLDEVVWTEAEIQRGRMPDRPFVLVGQQYLADPVRSSGNIHPVWAYAHVPHGYTGDATASVLGQIERFAPGFRERTLAVVSRSPRQLSAENPNYIGGDIINGANTPLQLVFRPRLTRNPYATGVRGVYLCSAATPPGAGVHGMCGFNAARYALHNLFRIDLSDNVTNSTSGDETR